MSLGQVRTTAVNGSSVRYLGRLGHVSGIHESWTIPGGCEQMTCVLSMADRTEALDPGRKVEVVRGGSVTWRGVLDEPSQSGRTWAITARGTGTLGANYTGQYAGAWSLAGYDTAVNGAITKGLPWINPGFSGTAGLWAGQAQDSGSVMIDGLLDQACTNGGLTWFVKQCPRGGLLQVVPLATTPNRLLVCTTPAARTLGGDINAIVIRYCTAPDLGGGHPATFALVTAVDQPSIDKHGRTEVPLDLSNAGPMLSADALAVGNYVLQRYQRASFAGPFTITAGQLLTIGGQPQDLGCFYIGNEGPMVPKLIMMDQGWGGEVIPGPVSFMVGRYEHDQDAGTAAVTPFNSLPEDFGTFLSQRAGLAKGRRFHIIKHGHRHVRWTGHGKHRRRHVTWTPSWAWGPAPPPPPLHPFGPFGGSGSGPSGVGHGLGPGE